jgi:ribosome maturation protein Sdo1|tara:strand:- start:476 stop:640 length:165 start_codon:yes stop_codon:yes gene_type:complete
MKKLSEKKYREMLYEIRRVKRLPNSNLEIAIHIVAPKYGVKPENIFNFSQMDNK